MRHIEVKLLWLQGEVRSGRLEVAKVAGATNVADALTKPPGVVKLLELTAPHGILPKRRAACTSKTVRPRGGVDPSVILEGPVANLAQDS